MDIDKIRSGFENAFGGGAQPEFFYAPGRVNLIGEHTDYNGGHVFPCALSLGTYGAIRKRNDKAIKLASGNVDHPIELSADEIFYDRSHGWGNYPKAVASELIGAGFEIGGFELYILGDLPNAAGLSSSASVEQLSCVALESIFSIEIDPIERVRLCQRAENKFVGVNCGIMDQFASGMCKKNHAVLLDCATLAHTHVPLSLGEYKLVISNTNKKRGLADSKYNERRSECDAALAQLEKVIDADCLCAITPDEFEKHSNAIQNEIIYKRAKHAIYENTRTLLAAEALDAGDLSAFGKLMNESHVSLRDLYEVTGNELDALAEAAWDADGVAGSRMTGAGFGGCTVSVVRSDATDSFIRRVGEAYFKTTGFRAEFYIAETDGGARRITGE